MTLVALDTLPPIEPRIGREWSPFLFTLGRSRPSLPRPAPLYLYASAPKERVVADYFANSEPIQSVGGHASKNTIERQFGVN